MHTKAERLSTPRSAAPRKVKSTPDMLTITGALAARLRPYKRFRRLYGAALSLQALMALAALAAPAWLAEHTGLPSSADADAWITAWGGMTLLAVAFQAPGFLEPVNSRLAVMTGIAGRLGMAVLFLILGGGFVWLAALEGLFGLALLWAFQALIKAEIMTRP